MTQFTHGGDDDQNPPVVHPDPDTPGVEAGKYVHPDAIPGEDDVTNNNDQM